MALLHFLVAFVTLMRCGRDCVCSYIVRAWAVDMGGFLLHCGGEEQPREVQGLCGFFL